MRLRWVQGLWFFLGHRRLASCCEGLRLTRDCNESPCLCNGSPGIPPPTSSLLLRFVFDFRCLGQIRRGAALRNGIVQYQSAPRRRHAFPVPVWAQPRTSRPTSDAGGFPEQWTQPMVSSKRAANAGTRLPGPESIQLYLRPCWAGKLLTRMNSVTRLLPTAPKQKTLHCELRSGAPSLHRSPVSTNVRDLFKWQFRDHFLQF